MTDTPTDTPPSIDRAERNDAPGADDALERAVDAWLALTAQRGWEIALADIAEEAGLPLRDLRRHARSKLSLFAAFSKQIDEAVLAEAALDPDLKDEAPRDRLFDVLMSRLEALAPHRAALRRLAKASLSDPELAAALLAQSRTALTWMMEAAHIDATGWRGRRRRALLGLAWGRTLATFLDDDDPHLGPSMAALDRHLREAERREKQALGLEDRLKPLFDKRWFDIGRTNAKGPTA